MEIYLKKFMRTLLDHADALNEFVDELYKDEQERKEALRRHNGFFNTHAVMFSR